MSNSGVNTGFAKCFILFMAIVILLQGVVYTGLAAWGIVHERCPDGAINVSEKPFDFAMDVIYFADRECGAPKVTITDVTNTTYTLDMDFDKSEEITDREYIFLIVYIVISALWIITSFLVITTICGTVTPTVSAICYWPWFLGIIAGSILDAVATGYHIHDIVHTTSSSSTFDYVGITLDDTVANVFSTFDAYFITPAVIMTCISSRVVLIWLLNIFGSAFCLSISKALANRSKAEKRGNIAPAPAQNIENNQLDIEPANPGHQHQPIQQQQVPQQPQYEERYPPQIKPKPLQIQTAIGPVDRQNSYQQQQQQNQRGDRRTLEPLKSPAVVTSASSPNTNDPRSSTTNEFPTYRNADTHPDKLDYPAQATPTDTRGTSPELSVISPLNNRYSAQEGPHYAHQPQPRVNDELRSQLPWSYTSMLANPPPPPQRRVQSQLVSPPPNNSIYPEVPEPDYALPPHRNARSTPYNSEINIQQPQSYSRW